MKAIFAILGIAVAVVLGYQYEPSMRYQLTGHAPEAVPAKLPPSAGTGNAVPGKPPPPAPAPTAAPLIDLAKLTAAQLPAQVMLKTGVEVTDTSGLKMKIEAGNRVRLIRIEHGWAIVSPGTTSFEGQVPVSGTDLMDQLAANPPAPAPPAVAVIDPAPAPVPAPIPTPAPTPVPEPMPAPVEPAPAGDSVEPGGVAPPAPTPMEEPAPPAQGVPAAAVDVVAVMKEHIRGGNIKEFQFSQVQGWKAEPDEVIDGETYQIGLIRYTAETIFGTKSIEAKALIKNGAVVKWIWPKSLMEIK